MQIDLAEARNTLEAVKAAKHWLNAFDAAFADNAFQIVTTRHEIVRRGMGIGKPVPAGTSFLAFPDPKGGWAAMDPMTGLFPFLIYPLGTEGRVTPADLHWEAAVNDPEPCCIAMVTSQGRDHTPDCSNRNR